MTQAILRNHYGENQIDNPLLEQDSVPENGFPNGITVTPTGTLEYEYTWEPTDWFSGTPIQIDIHSLDDDGYVEVATKKYTLEGVCLKALPRVPPLMRTRYSVSLRS
jgi:hypothetical protein